MSKKRLAAAIAGLALLGGASSSFAIDTLVQYSTTGAGDGVNNGAAGGYDVTGILAFDWQSSGDLVIENSITVNGAANTLADYFGGGLATAGDKVEFNIHAQARLNDMLNAANASIAPSTLVTDGASSGFEITAVLDAVETGTVGFDVNGNAKVEFSSITGQTLWYHDDSPDSVVKTGAGFKDGVNILTADLVDVFGSFTAGKGGDNQLTTKVTNYDSSYIQTDPTANSPLIGTSFDTLINIATSLEDQVQVGGVIGDPYTVQALDQVFKADANSKFSGVPEPATLFLFGAGLLGLAGFGRRSGTTQVA